MICVPGGARTASDAVDFPRTAGGVGEREDLGEAVSDDSGDADDECDALVGLRWLIVVELLLREERGRRLC